MLFVHAHPDDESITNGSTIARYVSQGADVRVLTCTLGEEGEVIGERYALLAVDHADQLGGYRIGELTRALNALGIDEPEFLGGPGRWRDSGMFGESRGSHRAFADAGPEAVESLRDMLDSFRPHVVVTYDPKGGYGHPDHVQAHRITVAAVAGAQWKVPKLYWTVLASDALQAALDQLSEIPSDWTRQPNLGRSEYTYADSDIDAVIDAERHLSAKVEALAAHATQLTLAPDRRSFALSNNVVFPVLSEEHFVLAAGEPGPCDSRGWETDLLAGIQVTS
jgi:N-acetyl-1-D-myo-inositol-2-amino-2-deoxy-alpha-D-glucopyranoside deacetylase